MVFLKKQEVKDKVYFYSKLQEDTIIKILNRIYICVWNLQKRCGGSRRKTLILKK